MHYVKTTLAAAETRREGTTRGHKAAMGMTFPLIARRRESQKGFNFLSDAFALGGGSLNPPPHIHVLQMSTCALRAGTAPRTPRILDGPTP